MIGVNFQPGQHGDGQNSNGGARPGSGVQEAIKVLSLRLPRVVGAQAAAPMALLNSQGGNGRVDSVVNQVMQRIAPPQGMTPPMGQPQAPQQPQSPPQAPGPSFTGAGAGGSQMTPSWPMPQAPQMPWIPPHITIGNPNTWGTDANLGGQTPPGMIAPLPNFQFPEPPQTPPPSPLWPQIGQGLGGFSGFGGPPPHEDQPLF